jgi:tripartite-type tricarboxylate transporter receptor subunit TctC
MKSAGVRSRIVHRFLLQRIASLVVLAIAAIATGYPAHADYPDHSIRIVVAYAPGGTNDILARLVAEQLSEILKQPVVVENRPGAGAIVGTNSVAKAEPDGYTLLVGSTSEFSFNPAIYDKLPYSPQDFAPIAMLGDSPLVLLVAADNPATNVKELVEASRRNPEKANYSSSGASFQLASEYFNAQTGGQFKHIPYKGSAQMVTAVLSGEVTMTLAPIGPAVAALKGNRLKALAITSSSRAKDLPDVPTMKELGIDLDVSLWTGLFVPRGTPEPFQAKLREAVNQITRTPAYTNRLANLSILSRSDTPAEINNLIQTGITRWSRLAKEKNIKVD